MSTKTCQQNQNIRPKGRRHSGNSSVRHSRVVRHSRGRSTRLRQLGPQRTVKRLSWLSLPLLFRDSKFHPGALCARVTIPPIASGLHLKTGHCRFQTRPPRVELGQCPKLVHGTVRLKEVRKATNWAFKLGHPQIQLRTQTLKYGQHRGPNKNESRTKRQAARFGGAGNGTPQSPARGARTKRPPPMGSGPYLVCFQTRR
jgi:hypothetical protein